MWKLAHLATHVRIELVVLIVRLLLQLILASFVDEGGLLELSNLGVAECMRRQPTDGTHATQHCTPREARTCGNTLSTMEATELAGEAWNA